QRLRQVRLNETEYGGHTPVIGGRGCAPRLAIPFKNISHDFSKTERQVLKQDILRLPHSDAGFHDQRRQSADRRNSVYRERMFESSALKEFRRVVKRQTSISGHVFVTALVALSGIAEQQG